MKIDTKYLKTVANYAKLIGRNRSRVYQMINEAKLPVYEIDGVTFIYTKQLL